VITMRLWSALWVLKRCGGLGCRWVCLGCIIGGN
jgi:hypothetical protein